MGCLNSDENFSHWFGNIHLSGPCNRSCYFCIGQHMMALDVLNNLDEWPLNGLPEFIGQCRSRNVTEVNLTGTNTDPLLYSHIPALANYLRRNIEGLEFGLRTNGAWALTHPERMRPFNKVSISVHSFDQDIYRAMMGSGYPPLVNKIVETFPHIEFKANIVLGPENVAGQDILRTIGRLEGAGFTKINIREPYGQPHIGDPLKKWGFEATGEIFGMPMYRPLDVADVVYWDVHYVEVESVNLYASGRVSETYPITKGHHPAGMVKGQEHFISSGRVHEQWLAR